MVAAWILENTKIDPLKVAKAYNITEAECWDYINDLNRVLIEAEKAHNALGLKIQVNEWVSTIPEAKAVKLAVLKEKLRLAKQYPKRYNVKDLLFQVDCLLGRAEALSPEKILRAKNYPIADLLNTQGKRGNISCPFHKDRTPSFEIKKTNTFQCYSCGLYGDVIDLYQKLHNVPFKEAVERLSP